jgi:hypothetical protein
MKKLLLMVMFVGFGISSIAQDKVKCTAGTAKAKKAVKKHRSVVKKKVTASKPVYVVRSVAAPIGPPCTGYRKNNIVVTECPGLMYDQDGRMEASSFNNYSGYLPLKKEPVILPAKDGVKVQPHVISNDPAVAPASGNFPR